MSATSVVVVKLKKNTKPSILPRTLFVNYHMAAFVLLSVEDRDDILLCCILQMMGIPTKLKSQIKSLPVLHFMLSNFLGLDRKYSIFSPFNFLKH